MSEASNPVLVTGCSSGIGHATAKRLAAGGHTVYATARRPESIADLAEDGCKTLALDVTDETSMKVAVEAVEKAVTSRRPRARYVVTPSAHLAILQRRLLPDRAWDAAMASQFPRPGA